LTVAQVKKAAPGDDRFPAMALFSWITHGAFLSFGRSRIKGSSSATDEHIASRQHRSQPSKLRKTALARVSITAHPSVRSYSALVP
jgi:hypothetical protein